MKQLPRFLQVLACIFQIAAWIFTAIALIGLIATFAVPGNIEAFLASGTIAGQDFVINGFGTTVISGQTITLDIVRWIIACGAVTMSLTAMIFRNLWLILRTLKGSDSFGETNTPFTPDITRMIREIGIFFMAIPVVELIFSCLMRLFYVDIDPYVDVTGIMTGLVIWYLSRIFGYGQKLQSDVEGLV
ncbi:hypothetical protein [Faecalibaculum rodentium]|uniref:hypothetical protein n=1 Tax=Faecalibaculum rodentium TaxID=1702221 RepID=UPI002586B716|nr:hypothetical protein [Faecalibaculum rodentium]